MDLGTTTVVVAFDDVDLHEQGFAKPSKRRGRHGAAALRLGVVQQERRCISRQPSGRGGASGGGGGRRGGCG